MFWKRKKTGITKEKSIKRLEQEKIINDWRTRLKKIYIPSLENALSNLEKKMNQYSLMEFDEDIQNINNIIAVLPDKERLLFNYDMGYKFSKSSKEFIQYFSEGHFINYPEMSYVETKNDVGLSFTANKNCLLYCTVYGDQLTQIPLNVEHPLQFTNNECKNLGEIYRKIGFFETAEFYRDIINAKDKGQDIKQAIDEILPDENENMLDAYYFNYINMCKNINGF